MKNFKVYLAAGVVALVVAVIACFAIFNSVAPSAGYSQSDVGKFPEGVENGGVGTRYYPISLVGVNSQGSYCNKSGRVQYVDLAVLRTTGIASSTFTLTAGTSTASSFNQFSVAGTIKALLNTVLATSTVATTTNSMQGPGATTGDGSGVVALANNACFNYGIYQTYGTACSGSVCETATSSNRGFNIAGYFRVIQP